MYFYVIQQLVIQVISEMTTWQCYVLKMSVELECNRWINTEIAPSGKDMYLLTNTHCTLVTTVGLHPSETCDEEHFLLVLWSVLI